MTMPLIRALSVVTALGLCVLPLHAKTKSGGDVSLTSRVFTPDDDPSTDDWGVTTDARLEFKAKQAGGFRQELRVLGRAAAVDESRSDLILEEFWAGWRGDWLDVLVGARLINWSATEAFHPADIINSRNLDSDIENAEKIGEPMASVRARLWQGGLTAFFMPLRLAPRLPGPRSRLNFSQGQPLGKTLWSNRDEGIDDGPWTSQWAARFDQTFAGLDLALHYVDHQDRHQPAIILEPNSGRIHPVYRRVKRYGGTAAQVLGEWILKAEVDHRRFDALDMGPQYQVLNPGAADHTAVAFGLEWGWGYSSGSEGTVLLEGQWMIADASADELETLGPFQRDILLGYRHALNDVEGTELLVGVIIDTQRPDECIANVTFTRRINDQWSLDSGLRIMNAPESKSLLHAQHEAHSVQLSLTRFF